jgi:hypothetical protein
MRALTGLTPEEFQTLVPIFAEVWEQRTERNWQGQPRHYAKGGGPKGALAPPEMKLFFILMYMRVYPIQAVIGFFFGFEQPQANKWVMKLLPTLDEALKRLAVLPVRQPAALEQLLARCGDLKLRLDGVDRPVRRPKHPEKQRARYSGRKKRHTVKNVVVTVGRIVKFLSPTEPGRQHDKTLAEPLEAVRFPRQSVVIADTGFQGLVLENKALIHPDKKPRGRELSPVAKQFNRVIASVRVKVEHVIGAVKRWRMVSDIFRNTKEGLEDLAMEIACGLHNFQEEKRTVAPNNAIVLAA